jgi:hypothetical protein
MRHLVDDDTFPKEMFERAPRNARARGLVYVAFLAVAIKFTEEHLVDGTEETLDSATALRLARGRKYKPNLEIDGHLFNML